MFGPDIKAAREHLGLEQHQLAALIGVHATWLSRIEAGSREIPWYLPLVLDLLERNPELIPGLLADGPSNRIGAPVWFATMVAIAARSNTRAVTLETIADELFGSTPEPAAGEGVPLTH